MPKAGQSIRQLAQQRRKKAMLRFGGAIGIVLTSVFVSISIITATGLKVLVFIVATICSTLLAREGLKLFQQANRADSGAKGEEIVELLLRDLEKEGWQIEYRSTS